jgi:hypothetical protein
MREACCLQFVVATQLLLAVLLPQGKYLVPCFDYTFSFHLQYKIRVMKQKTATRR